MKEKFLAGIAIYSIVLSSFIFISCKTPPQKSPPIEVLDDTGIIFLDSTEAAKKIIIDRMDGYFETISLTDMSIQLKRTDVSLNREETVEEYKRLLQTEMSDFTEEEKSFMRVVFTEAKAAIDKVNPNLWVDGIELFKSKLNHYGSNVYYTREKGIILPENIFENPSVKVQMPVMLHEIFHILSRYNSRFRNEIYELIGFRKLHGKLILPDPLEKIKLTNPDGVGMAYAVDLKDNRGRIQKAIPIMASAKPRYTKSMPSFFAYFKFDLYPVIKSGQGNYTIGLNKNGESALSAEHHADFFEQIKDNTQYIIHPDEILADNFMMAVIAERDQNFDNFSERGLPLIKDVLDVLRKFE